MPKNKNEIQPNLPKTFALSESERLRLQNNALRQENLKLMFERLQLEQATIIDDFCKRVLQKKEDITNINIETGTVEFSVAKDEDKQV